MREFYHPQPTEIKMTQIMHALSDPIRLSIAKRLQSGEQCCYNFCADNYGIAKSTFSHHMRVLRESGVIRVRVEGKVHHYSLRSEELEKFSPGLLVAVLGVSEEYI